ncbi:hypothetical protein N9R67_00450 [Candidatus Actinomarina sp.]|nr:hypothetical protein [Candidatus Actinomarina sp.]
MGSNSEVSVQSMTTTKTRNTDETLEQIYALAAKWCRYSKGHV